MATYSLGVRTAATASGAAAAIVDLRTAANNRAYVREIGCFVTAATQTQIGIIRPSTVGTTSTAASGQAVDTGDAASTAQIGSAWSVAPAISGTPIYLRRATLGAAIGNGLIWTFGPRDLIIPANTTLLLWNFGSAANAALDLYIVWQE